MVQANTQTEKKEIFEEFQEQLEDYDRREDGKNALIINHSLDKHVDYNFQLCEELRLW